MSVPQAHAETLITPTFSIDTSFTDNVRDTAKGTEESDVFATIAPGFIVSNSSARTNLNLQYQLSAERHKDAKDLDEERHTLTGIGGIDVIRDYLTVDARSSLSREVVNRAGPASVTDRNVGSNQLDTLTYSVTPRLRHGISNWAVSEASYSFSQSIFDPFGNQTAEAGSSQDSVTNQIGYSLTSGRMFPRFGWSMGADYSRTSPEGGSSTNSLAGSATLNYTVNRFFTPRVSLGYDRFRSSGGGVNDTSGISWAVGADVVPGPRTAISVEYGRNFDDNHIQGSASFRIAPTVTLTATAQHEFALEQEQLTSNLQDLTVDRNGNLIDAETGLPFSPTAPGSDLTEVNNVTRTQTYTLALTGARGRNSYNMFTSARELTNNQSGRKTTTLTSSAGYSRTLTPHANLNLSASISGTEDNTAADTQTASVTTSFSYRLGESVSGTANYSYTQTNSSAVGGDRRENTITARLLISF